jgi:hypothetical protein
VSTPPDPHGPSFRLPAPPPPDPTGWYELRRRAAATLWPPQPVAWAALLAVAVTLAGLAGLWFQATLPSRLPTPTDWKAVASVLGREARPGDVVALAPPWAERGRELLPDRIPSRPDAILPVLAFPSYAEADEDLPGVRRVWLVSLPGVPGGPGPFHAQLAARAERFEGPQRIGRLELTRYDLRSPSTPLWSLADRLPAASIEPAGAGVTREIREVGFLPRTCAVTRFAGPDAAPVTIRLPGVPVGRTLRGHLGIVGDAPSRLPSVSARVKLDGVDVGGTEISPGGPLRKGFTVDTSRFPAPTRDVTVEVLASGPLPRGACLELEALP